MKLTDELRIINSAIKFADENNLEYSIHRHLTICAHKKIRIDFRKGIPHELGEQVTGTDFAINKTGDLVYKQIHVYPGSNLEKTEELRLYLQKKFPEFQCKW